MTDPLSTTFDLLTTTESKFAIDVLVSGLEVNNEAIREHAALALIKRKGTRGTVEVIRRQSSLSQRVRLHFDTYRQQVSGSLRQCLMHGDEELQRNALEIILATDNYELFPELLDLLQAQDDGLFELVHQTFEEMVNLVFENCHVDPDRPAPRRKLSDVSQVRRNMLMALDKACTNFDTLKHPETLLHAVLVLGDSSSFAVKKILSQSNPQCRELAAEILMSSKHPGVMQLPLDYMSQNYPHAKASKAIESRSDPEFICHLLRWFPRRLSENQQKNFSQITSVAWLNPYGLTLDMIPPGLQESLVDFVQAIGIPADQKLTVQEWIVRNGSPEGRLAAAEVLSSSNKNIVQDVIFQSLDSPDDEVQAWATSQLRSQGIPEAFSMLIERLDSPMEAVCNAAREELQGFDVERMMNFYEHIDPEVCLRAGDVIRKIDPHLDSKLQRELRNPICRKRIRAAKAVQAMGLHVQAVASFIEMLEDEDAMIRRTAIEILTTIPTAESAQALQTVLDDPSTRVREAARKALQTMQDKGIISPVV